MPRHVVATVATLLILVLATSALFSWLSVRYRLPVIEDLVLSLQNREARQTQAFLSNNLQLMATRVGELQARVMQLDMLGQRVERLSGVRHDAPGGGQGGPLLPSPATQDRLQLEIDHLASTIERKSDDLAVLENRLLEERVRARRMPTALPVAHAVLGSPFGHRADPIVGVRAMHEGIDFNAEIGAPVKGAADGVVLTAEFRPDFGNVVEIDHGEGLLTRYAHLSQMDVLPGALVKRGQRIGAIGMTGRTTGPHLHFEVRMMGVAQNPAAFLQQGAASGLAHRLKP